MKAAIVTVPAMNHGFTEPGNPGRARRLERGFLYVAHGHVQIL